MPSLFYNILFRFEYKVAIVKKNVECQLQFVSTQHVSKRRNNLRGCCKRECNMATIKNLKN